MEEQTGEPARAGLPEAALNPGSRMMDQGAFAEAIVAYRKLIALAPQFGPGYRNLALALERDGKYTEALSACGRAIELQPEDLEAYLV
ncbi:tetratricopeptide repeat protein, partial [Lactobacillus crispatus]|uniref:tetratricopeptide repeat protein n=1 Tax=Lactobacillus crispatus TaxID=47770 RepID=UPI0010E0176A